jgi:transglutaminase-like putative cysteine protease
MSVVALRAVGNPPVVRRSVTAAVAVAMTALTGAAVLSAGWTDGSASALLIGVAGALEAAAVVALRPPRVLAAAALAALLALTVMLPTVGTVPVHAHSSPLTVLGHYIGAAVLGLLGNAQWEFNVGLGTLLWACGAWSMQMALRGRRGALATAPVWAVLAVNVINAPDPAHAALPSMLAAAAAVLLIAAVQLESLSGGWGRRGVAVLPGTNSRFALASGVGALVVLVLALLLPPLSSTDISGRIFGFGTGGSGSVTGTGAGATVRFSRATVPGGPLTEANAPVLTYTTDAGTGAYLQMATDSVFVSGTWLPDDDAAATGLVDETMRPGPIRRDRAAADGGVGRSVQSVAAHILITNDSSGAGVLPFPGEPDASSIPIRVSGLTVGPTRGLVTVDNVEATDSFVNTTITTTGTVSSATADQLRAAGTVYPGFITADGFTAMPDDGTGGAGVVAELALQWTQGLTNPYDRATAIEDRLRDPRQFTYTLAPPVASPGSPEWPIVYFLSTSHAGYCQYFAASMGAMLRSLGIPARLINGYGPGVTNQQENTSRNALRVFHVTSDDAHTWVEAYFPGYGWIPFEPTPPSTAGQFFPFARGGASASPTPTATPAPTPRGGVAAPTSRGSSGGSTGAGGFSGNIPLLAVGVAAGLLVLLLAVAGAWLTRPSGIAGVWRRLALVGRLLGARRTASQTLDEYVGRLAAAIPAGPEQRDVGFRVREALDEISALSERALYARSAPPPEEAVRLRQAWARVTRLLPAVGWRAVTRHGAAP